MTNFICRTQLIPVPFITNSTLTITAQQWIINSWNELEKAAHKIDFILGAEYSREQKNLNTIAGATKSNIESVEGQR